MTITHHALALSLGLVACTTEPPPTTYLGRTSDADVFIALSTDGATTAAYLCDGNTRANTPDLAPRVTVWLTSDAADAGAGIDLAAQGITAHAAFAGDAASGTVTIGNSTLTFDAARVRGADTGFFIADETIDGGRVVGGWIALPDGEQRGAVAFDGGGGLGKVVTGPVLQPRTGTILVSNLGSLRVKAFDPRGFVGSGIQRLPSMGMGGM